MFAQGLIVLLIFGCIVYFGWKIIGKRLTAKVEEELTEPKTPEEEAAALKLKIAALKRSKMKLEAVQEEIDVTADLTKVKTTLFKAENRLKTLDEKLENVGVQVAKHDDKIQTETTPDGSVEEAPAETPKQ